MPKKTILITGGAGYKGSVLVPKLLEKDYAVRVLDTFWFGKDVFDSINDSSNLTLIEADMRDAKATQDTLEGVDTVIHLASISNDPCSDLNAELTRSINGDASFRLVDDCKNAGVKRFIYASSSSVYGVKDVPDVTEDLAYDPLTLYAELKMKLELHLLDRLGDGFEGVIIRPASVMGFGPRQRLDLTVNMFTHFAKNRGKITVFGGKQLRPHVHIGDICDIYTKLVAMDGEKINGEKFNVGHGNHSVGNIAEMVKKAVGDHVKIEYTETQDFRSYHVNSDKLHKIIGIVPEKDVIYSAKEISQAFDDGLIPDPENERWINVKFMKTHLPEWMD